MSMPNLEQRVNRLERQNRLLKAALFSGLCAIGVTWTLGTTQPEKRVLEAREVRITDTEGRLRGLLAAAADGVHLSFYDKADKQRSMLALTETGPHLTFSDANGNERAQLVLVSQGPQFSLLDENKKSGIKLNLVKSTPTLGFQATTGENLVFLGVLNDRPFISCSDGLQAMPIWKAP